MTVVILILIVGLLFFLPRPRTWILEEIKAFSDVLIVGLLRLTSRFGSELTSEGKAEQALWRERQLRNLRGLALRSKEAFSGQRSSKKDQEKYPE